MIPNIIELPERERNPKYIIDPNLTYFLNILSYLSCTIYEIDDNKDE